MSRLLLLALLAVAVTGAARAQYAVSVPAASGAGTDTVVAPDGTVYLAGYAGSGVDFDPSPSVRETTAPTGFVAAYDDRGKFQWAWAEPDGFSRATIESVAVRPGGGVFAVGQLRGTIDADPGPGVTTVTGNSGLLVLALSASGTLDWALALDGGAQVWAQGVGADAAGNVYLAGWIQSSSGQGVDLDPGSGVVEVSTTSTDLFVASYDASGTFRWAFDVGTLPGESPSQVRGYDLAVDASSVYVTGSFRGTRDFDPGPASAEETASGTDGFVARYGLEGGYQWATRFGRTLSDIGYGVAATGDGGALVTGVIEDRNTQEDILVARLDASGAEVWAHALGTEGGTLTDRDEGRGIALIGSRAVVAGRFDSTFDADPGPDETLVSVPSGAPFNGVYGFVAAYDFATGDFDTALRIGDVSQTSLSAVAAGPSAQAPVAVAGTFTASVTLPDGDVLTAPAAFSTNPFGAGFVLVEPAGPLAVVVEERIAVTDMETILEALRVVIAERIGVVDHVSLLEALQLLIQERIGVVDEDELMAALLVLIEERIGARDGLGLDAPGASVGVSFVSVDGRVVYAGNVALGLGLAGVQGMGEVGVLRVVDGTNGQPPTVLDNRWIVAVQETVSFSDASDVRIDLAATGMPPGDPGALTILFRPPGARGGDIPLATSFDADTQSLVGVGLPGSGEIRVVASTSRAPAPPVAFTLHAPFPNPSAGAVTIPFDLPMPGDVSLAVYDVLGRRVAVLADGPFPAGRHQARLDAGALGAGTYLVRLAAGTDGAMRRITLAR